MYWKQTSGLNRLSQVRWYGRKLLPSYLFLKFHFKYFLLILKTEVRNRAIPRTLFKTWPPQKENGKSKEQINPTKWYGTTIPLSPPLSQSNPKRRNWSEMSGGLLLFQEGKQWLPDLVKLISSVVQRVSDLFQMNGVRQLHQPVFQCGHLFPFATHQNHLPVPQI